MFPNDLGISILDPGQPAARIVPALLVTVLFGLFGYLTQGVNRSGALAGTAAAFPIYVALGLGGFATLLCVFTVTWLTTRIGYGRKRQLGLAEDTHGRGAGQVLANLSAAAGFALLSLKLGPIWAVASVACLAEAAADTASSEIGEAASDRAWLIAGFQRVPPGTNGAISLAGTSAGWLAAALVACVALVSDVAHSVGIVIFAGFTGTLVDSLLGATFERAGRIGNNTVNFLSTVAAGLIALALISL